MSERRNPPHRSSVLDHQVEVEACLLIDLIAPGALEGEHPRQKARAGIARNDASHDGADLRVDERHREVAQQICTGLVVGVENQRDVVLGRRERLVEAVGLAAQLAASDERPDALVVRRIAFEDHASSVA
jgi:hypothetical protein